MAPHSTAPLALACVLAVLGGAFHGCGETIDLSRPGGRDASPTPIAYDAGPAPSAGPPLRDAATGSAPTVASMAQLLTECGNGGGAAAGGIGGGLGVGGAVNCGGSTSVQCLGGGRGVRATITPLDCDLKTGFAGDPTRLQTRCDEALDGQSGEGCQGPFICGRPVGDTCCVQVASCKSGSPLIRYSVCPGACMGQAEKPSQHFVGSCDDLKALWQLDAGVAAWLGMPCAGPFVCFSSRSLLSQVSVPTTDFLYYCANGALQMLPLFVVGP